MKKVVLFMSVAAMVAFTSCSNDKDEEDNTCNSCTAKGETYEICDNGDGTYTFNTPDGSSTIYDLEGLTAKQTVESTCEVINSLDLGL